MSLGNNPQSIVNPGIYPMLYTFFEDSGVLRRDPFLMQVDTILSSLVNHDAAINKVRAP